MKQVQPSDYPFNEDADEFINLSCGFIGWYSTHRLAPKILKLAKEKGVGYMTEWDDGYWLIVFPTETAVELELEALATS